MYKAFRIDVETLDFKNLIQNESIFRDDLIDENTLLEQLEQIISHDKINAHDIIDTWFQDITAQVFLSHSSNDRDLVNQFANWLEREKEVKPFIDAEVWGHIDNLSEALHEQFAKKTNGKLDYKKIRNIDSHIHIMLTHALRKIIDKTECFIFLASPFSLDVSEVTENTYSPWIFHELATVDSIIPRTPPRLLSESFSSCESYQRTASKANIFYTPPQNKLTCISMQKLQNLNFTKHRFLNKLYELN